MYIQFEVAPKGEVCDSGVITTFQSTVSPDNASGFINAMNISTTQGQ